MPEHAIEPGIDDDGLVALDAAQDSAGTVSGVRHLEPRLHLGDGLPPLDPHKVRCVEYVCLDRAGTGNTDLDAKFGAFVGTSFSLDPCFEPANARIIARRNVLLN